MLSLSVAEHRPLRQVFQCDHVSKNELKRLTQNLTCSFVSSFYCSIPCHSFTLCLGTWPNGVWNTDNSYAGQSEGSCASTTGFDTCEAYVQSRGWDFKHGESLYPFLISIYCTSSSVSVLCRVSVLCALYRLDSSKKTDIFWFFRETAYWRIASLDIYNY